jgi:hypothetical protein
MIPHQENPTFESQETTSTSLTERVSPQNTDLPSNHQTKNLSSPDPNHPIPVLTTSPHNATHTQLTQALARLPHHQPEKPQDKQDSRDIRHQTQVALASLIFNRHNHRPQQIWRLRLLQLEQQRLLSNQIPHHQQHQHHSPITLDLNKSLVVYTTPCDAFQEDLEALEGLEDLADLEDLEDQESLRDPLQQYLRQPQPQTLTTGLWGIFPKCLTENTKTPEPSSTLYLGTSERTLESQGSIHPLERFPSHSPSSRGHRSQHGPEM